jgi:hypothetical protein
MRAVGVAAAVLTAASLAACASTGLRPRVSPAYLGRAHAHNDYERGRPLFDALERGFGSIEVDVVLVDGAIYVAHDRDEIRPADTLARLYLEPLEALAGENGGSIYATTDASLQLLIDVKSPAEEIYPVLDALLGSYDGLLTRWSPDGIRRGAVTAVLSGNRPFTLVHADSVRYVALDGRIDEERSAFSPETMPLVSIDWAMVEAYPPSERLEVARAWIDLVHAENRRVRFWGTPERGQTWTSLLEMGADHIGADDVARLEQVLRTQ